MPDLDLSWMLLPGLSVHLHGGIAASQSDLEVEQSPGIKYGLDINVVGRVLYSGASEFRPPKERLL